MYARTDEISGTVTKSIADFINIRQDKDEFKKVICDFLCFDEIKTNKPEYIYPI